MKKKVCVYINEIVQDATGIRVSASNGGVHGPPLVTFRVDQQEAKGISWGQALYLTIEDKESHDAAKSRST